MAKNTDEKNSRADTGNATNPSPHDTSMEPAGNNQLLNKKAETYLREAGNIEDMPDAADQEDADQSIHGKKT